MKHIRMLIFFLVITNVWSDNGRYVSIDYYLLNGKIIDELKEGFEFLDNPLSIINITNLDKNDLRILRNAIYAKHGYIFRSSDLHEYFVQFSWYKAEYYNVDDRLTETDKNNVSMIQMVESNYPENTNEYIGIWWDPPYDRRFAVSAEGPNQIRIFPNGIFTGRISGLWSYENNIFKLNDEIIIFERKNIVMNGNEIGDVFLFDEVYWWKEQDNSNY